MLTETRIEISPSCQGRVNKMNLIGAEFESMMVLAYPTLGTGIVFEVVSKNYVLGLEMRENDVVLVRNDKAIIIPFAEPENREEYFILNFAWCPTFFRLFINDKEGHRGYEAKTEPIFPPHELKQWARRQALIPTVEYETGEHLFESVVDQFLKLQHSIKDTNGINGFWNIEYNGRKIKERKPKKETDIHPTIRLLFDDLEIIKNFQVVPEYPIGGGKLDFLITAPLKDGSTGKVCVEFKNAHSNDLANGLIFQLPEYMERARTDYGIYAVIDYQAPYDFKPNLFKVENYPNKFDNLEVALSMGASQTNRRYLRPIILSVGSTDTPSKRRK